MAKLKYPNEQVDNVILQIPNGTDSTELKRIFTVFPTSRQYFKKSRKNRSNCQTPTRQADLILETMGAKEYTKQKLFTILENLQEAGYRPNEKKSERARKESQGNIWLEYENKEKELKPNKKKEKAILGVKLSASSKILVSLLGAIQDIAKFLPRRSEKTDQLGQSSKETRLKWIERNTRFLLKSRKW